jgi:hypothetical protein
MSEALMSEATALKTIQKQGYLSMVEVRDLLGLSPFEAKRVSFFHALTLGPNYWPRIGCFVVLGSKLYCHSEIALYEEDRRYADSEVSVKDYYSSLLAKNPELPPLTENTPQGSISFDWLTLETRVILRHCPEKDVFLEKQIEYALYRADHLVFEYPDRILKRKRAHRKGV